MHEKTYLVGLLAGSSGVLLNGLGDVVGSVLDGVGNSARSGSVGGGRPGENVTGHGARCSGQGVSSGQLAKGSA